MRRTTLATTPRRHRAVGEYRNVVSGVLTDETVGDLGDVSTGEEIVDDPIPLRLQEVHYVLDRRPVRCGDITHTHTHRSSSDSRISDRRRLYLFNDDASE